MTMFDYKMEFSPISQLDTSEMTSRVRRYLYENFDAWQMHDWFDTPWWEAKGLGDRFYMTNYFAMRSHFHFCGEERDLKIMPVGVLYCPDCGRYFGGRMI